MIQKKVEWFSALAQKPSLSAEQRALAARLQDNAAALGNRFKARMRSGQGTPKPVVSVFGLIFFPSSIVHLLASAGIGYLLVAAAAIPLALISTFASRQFFNYGLALIFLGMSLGVVGLHIRHLRERFQADKKRYSSESRAFTEELSKIVDGHEQELTALDYEWQGWVDGQRQLVEKMQSASKGGHDQVRLSAQSLAAAKRHLDEAQRELGEGAFVAFWDLIEKAGVNLSDVLRILASIRAEGKVYDASLSGYRGSEQVPVFSVVASTLDLLAVNAQSLFARLRKLSYDAQKNPHFAQIYELRRNTQTLVEGFATLRDALDGLGTRIEAALYHLGDNMSDGFVQMSRGLDRIQESVAELTDVERQASASAAESAKILADIKVTANQSFAEMQKHVNFSRASAVEALISDYEMKVMLHSIQTGRKASPHFPPGRSPDFYGTILDAGPKLPA